MPDKSFAVRTVLCTTLVLCGVVTFVASALTGTAVAADTVSIAATPTTRPEDGASVPSESPDETAPSEETPEPTVPPSDTVDPPAVDADDDNVVVGVIAVAGCALLVAVAGWWMVGRRDSDGGPHPGPNPDDALPGRDLI